MKEFLLILLFILIVPLVVGIVLYLGACFITFSIIKISISFIFLRIYVLASIILSIIFWEDQNI